MFDVGCEFCEVVYCLLCIYELEGLGKAKGFV